MTGDTSWIEPLVPTRTRVLRSAPRELTEFDLTPVEVLEASLADLLGRSPDETPSGCDATDDGIDEVEEQRRGAAAIAWAAGYRDGQETGRAEGLQTGRLQGIDEGRAAALAEGREAFDHLLRSLSSEFEAVSQKFADLSDAVSEQSLELAMAVASSVLERELAVARDPGSDAILRAARHLRDDGSRELSLTVRINPDDAGRVGTPADVLLPGREVKVVADPGVEAGGCVMDCGATRIDTSIAGALERVRAALTGVGRC